MSEIACYVITIGLVEFARFEVLHVTGGEDRARWHAAFTFRTLRKQKFNVRCKRVTTEEADVTEAFLAKGS